MPTHESHTVTVTTTVEVDGHVLTFTEERKASGARYDGNADTNSYGRGSVLEWSVRNAVAAGLTRANERAVVAIGRLWPVHPDVEQRL